ncbi:tetratricopeptide repeat protein [Treponema primitia]|uniref:tetratricopeptide repeat protein n=1 Tax=Treponema primitia TaxID=88058 RepID=UPI003980FDB4
MNPKKKQWNWGDLFWDGGGEYGEEIKQFVEKNEITQFSIEGNEFHGRIGHAVSFRVRMVFKKIPSGKRKAFFTFIENHPQIGPWLYLGIAPYALLACIQRAPAGSPLADIRQHTRYRCSCQYDKGQCTHKAAFLYLISRKIEQDPYFHFRLYGLDLRKRYNTGFSKKAPFRDIFFNDPVYGLDMPENPIKLSILGKWIQSLSFDKSIWKYRLYIYVDYLEETFRFRLEISGPVTFSLYKGLSDVWQKKYNPDIFAPPVALLYYNPTLFKNLALRETVEIKDSYYQKLSAKDFNSREAVKNFLNEAPAVLELLSIELVTMVMEQNPKNILALVEQDSVWFQYVNEKILTQEQYQKICESAIKRLSADGVEAHNAHNFQEAIKVFTAAIDKIPGASHDANLFHNRGFIYQRLHKYDEAINDYLESLRIAPNALRYYYDLHELYDEMDDYTQADIYFDKALKLDLDLESEDELDGDIKAALLMEQNPESMLVLVKQDSRWFQYVNEKMLTQEQFQKICEAALNRLFAEGNEAYAAKYFKKALKAYTMAIDKIPGGSLVADLFNKRSCTYRNLHKYDEAINDVLEALRIAPYKAPYYYNLGYSYYKMKDHTQADIYFDKALKLLNPKDKLAGDIWYMKAVIAQKNNPGGKNET